MVTELWRWQHNNEEQETYLRGAAFLADGSPVVAGFVGTENNGTDFVALKLDAEDGTPVWEWTDGSEGDDEILAAAAGADGSVVLAGFTGHHWVTTSTGGPDFAAVKLDADGNVLWKWQNGTEGFDYIFSLAIGEDESVTMGGHIDSNDFVLVKLDADGNQQWQWTTDGAEVSGRGVALAEDGSAVLAGLAYGDWDGETSGFTDFAAVKVDQDGQELWRWQDGTALQDDLSSAAAAGDDAVLTGSTEGSYAAGHAGSRDVVALKLDSSGSSRLWSWQDGTAGDDEATASAMVGNGSVAMCGATEGDWDAFNLGEYDFMAVGLDATDGTELWRWQDGTEGSDYLTGMAGSGDRIILTGYTMGSFARTHNGDHEQGVAVMLTTEASVSSVSDPSSSAAWTAVIAVLAAAVLIGAIAGVWIWKKRSPSSSSTSNQPADAIDTVLSPIPSRAAADKSGPGGAASKSYFRWSS